MRGQRAALATVLAWLALLSMLLGALPLLEPHVPGAAALVLQVPVEERSGGEQRLQEETPAKPRRVAGVRPAATPPQPPLPVSLDALMATLADLPPQVVPAVDSAPAAPLPAAPGLRVQRGQAPPQG